MNNQQVYLIGNAHIDPVWLWKRGEGYAEIKATFQSALDRMEEFEAYVFTAACASYYRWIEENEPAMFEKIRRRVAEGRWAIAGGMWVQPDCNLPSGESFARHLLYSQGYFQRAFGHIPAFGYNVDSFGHNGMLPQLLRLAGMESYVFMRPDSREKELPDLFDWQSPDGSRVTVYRIIQAYTERGWFPGVVWNNPELSIYRAKLYEMLEASRREAAPHMLFYGVGNHGGGPTRFCLEETEAVLREEKRALYASPREYFADVRAELAKSGETLPLVSGDLQQHASGCYAAYSPIKRWNRITENRLVSAEKYDVMAATLTGAPRNADSLRRGWDRLMFNQFHDILAGCAIKSAMEEACRYAAAAWTEGDETALGAMLRLSWNINTSRGLLDKPSGKSDWLLWETDGEGAPIVVFNPHVFAVDTLVQINRQGITAAEDDKGTALPLQAVRGGQSNGDDWQNTVFPVSLPPLGWKTYYLYREKTANVSPGAPVTVAGTVMENGCLRAAVDETAGTVTLTDKTTGRTVMAGGCAALLIDDGDSDTWAHGIYEFNKVIGKFTFESACVTEDGPLRATLRATYVCGPSSLRQEFSLVAGKPLLYVRSTLDFHETRKIVKLAFPFTGADPAGAYEMPFGWLEKPCDGWEQPAHRFADISSADAGGSRFGLAVISEDKYSFSAAGGELRMMIARSCAFADHFADRSLEMEFMDQGVTECSYALMPWSGDRAALTREAMLFNQPVEHAMETNHPGTLGTTGSMASVESASVVCEAVKMAEDGDGLILRLYETAGRADEAAVALRLPGFESGFIRAFGPHEIRTVRVGSDGRAADTDLLERPL